MNLLPLLLTCFLGAATPTTDTLDADPARWFPAETLFYFGSVGCDATKDLARETPAGKLWYSDRLAPLRAGLPRIISRLIEQETAGKISEESLGMLRQLLTIGLTRPVGFGLAGLELDPLEPKVYAYAVIDGGEASDDLLALIDSVVHSSGMLYEDPEIRSVSGGRFRVISPPDDSPFELLYGIVDGALIVGIGEESIRFATDCAAGKLPTLASSSRWQRGMQRSIHDATPTSALHFDIPGLLDLALGTMEEFGAELPDEMVTIVDEFVGRLGPLHLASGIEKAGFISGWDIPFDGLPGVGRPLEASDFRSAPLDGMFQMAATYDLSGAWEWGRSLIEMNVPEEDRWQIDQALRTAEALMGVDIEELFTAIGDRVLIYEETRARGLVPALVISLSGGEPKMIEQAVRQMGLMLATLSGEFGVRLEEKKLETRHGLVRWFQLFGAPVPVAPAWTIRDGELLVALHPTVIEETLRPREDGEAGSAIDLAAVANEAGSANYPTSLLSFDIGELMKVVWPTLIPGIQTLLGESVRLGVPLDASVLPPASAFEEWQVVCVSFDDENGSRGFLRTPFSLLKESAAGLPLLALALPRLIAEEEAREDQKVQEEEAAKKRGREYF